MSSERREKRDYENVTCEDVYLAIERGTPESDKDCKKKAGRQPVYYLYYEGKKYKSKDIFNSAYKDYCERENKKIKTIGGGIEKGMCAYSLDRLGFEIVSEGETSENYSWSLIDKDILVKKMGKVFIGENGFIIRKDWKGVREFFDVGNIETVFLCYRGEEYTGSIINLQGNDRVVFEEKLEAILELFYNKELKKYPSIRFQKISKIKYDVQFLDDGLVENEKKESYETIVPQKDGKKREYYVTLHERKSANRKNAIMYHGTKCKICEFDFEEVYGEAGRNYIEVHHIKPLAEVEEAVEVNPETDLVCMCKLS